LPIGDAQMPMKQENREIDNKTIPNWFKIIQIEDSLGPTATPRNISVHTGLAVDFVEASLADPYFLELREAYKQERYNLWSQLLADHKADFDSMVNALVPAAIMRLGRVIENGEEKNAVKASSEILDRATGLSRPADVHIYEHRFSQKELDEARRVARSLGKPEQPQLPGHELDAEVVDE
jgi:hypothetical protein